MTCSLMLQNHGGAVGTNLEYTAFDLKYFVWLAWDAHGGYAWFKSCNERLVVPQHGHLPFYTGHSQRLGLALKQRFVYFC